MPGAVSASLVDATRKDSLCVSDTSVYCSSSSGLDDDWADFFRAIGSAQRVPRRRGRKGCEASLLWGNVTLSTLWKFFHISIILRLTFPWSDVFYI